jgi:hypothetical protein
LRLSTIALIMCDVIIFDVISCDNLNSNSVWAIFEEFDNLIERISINKMALNLKQKRLFSAILSVPHFTAKAVVLNLAVCSISVDGQQKTIFSHKLRQSNRDISRCPNPYVQNFTPGLFTIIDIIEHFHQILRITLL